MRTIPPPQGYSTWLDYAISTMDTRSALLEMGGLFEDALEVDPLPSSDDLRAAARAELEALRSAAKPSDPT